MQSLMHAAKSRAASGSRPAAPATRRHPIDGLQRALGNDAVGQLAEAGALAPICASQAKSGVSEDAVAVIVEQTVNAPGQPLAPEIRADMEARFGHGFGGVRIHNDGAAATSAAAINARAYTVGSHIAFASGQYAPEAEAGRLLLAHELAHVIQQGRGGALPTSSSDCALEASAEQAATAAVQDGSSVQVGGASGVGVARQQLSAQERKQLEAEYQRRLARVRDRLQPNRGGPLPSFHVKGTGSGQPGQPPGSSEQTKTKPPATPTPGPATKGDPAGNSDFSKIGDPGQATAKKDGDPGITTGTGEPLTELDYLVRFAGIVNLEFGDDEEGVSGGIPGGHGDKENASEAAQSLYAALAIFDVVSIGKALWSLGKAVLKKGIETAAERIAGKALAKQAIKEAEAKLIREGLEKAENKSAYIGRKIIGWGEHGTAHAAEQTLKIGETLTEDGVRDMIAKGLTKEWVEKQLATYEQAIVRGTLEKNPLLDPRRLLMKRILELWPR
jgi:hypothetical protein